MSDMSGEPQYTYEGQELDLFAEAQNWKRYFRDALAPYIRGRVAEVGAGNGSTTGVLSSVPHETWFALEPDSALMAKLIQKQKLGSLPKTITPVTGDLSKLGGEQLLDTILYVDVLEHIVDDVGELRNAAAMLAPGGHLIILSPAYQLLFTPFDKAIGHQRRYTLAGLKRLSPAGMSVARGFYLDSVGVLASVANLLLLRQSKPGMSQILFWDRVMVPCSKAVDLVTARTFGRSVIVVWKRDETR